MKSLARQSFATRTVVLGGVLSCFFFAFKSSADLSDNIFAAAAAANSRTPTVSKNFRLSHLDNSDLDDLLDVDLDENFLPANTQQRELQTLSAPAEEGPTTAPTSSPTGAPSSSPTFTTVVIYFDDSTAYPTVAETFVDPSKASKTKITWRPASAAMTLAVVVLAAAAAVIM